MTLVADTLRTSTVTDELGDSEVDFIAGLFDVQNYHSGEIIVKPGDMRPENLYILAYGAIDVKVESGDGDFSLHVLTPGDLAGMITFVGGLATQISATLYAVGDTKVLSLGRAEFEKLIHSHPMIVYRVMRGMTRSMHAILRRGNIQSAELSNYIHNVNGRY